MQQVSFFDYLQLLKIKSYHDQEAVLILKNIVQYIRPKKRKNADEAVHNLQQLALFLENDIHLKNGFQDLFANIIVDSNITDLLTDNGIVTGVTFSQQAKKILGNKIIPPYQDPTDINTILQTVFNKKWDWLWIKRIPKETLQIFVQQINDCIKAKQNDIETELCNAAKLVSYRIASLGLEKEILIRANKKEELISCFTQQNIDLIHFFEADANETETQLNALRATLIVCSQSLIKLEKNSIQTGTSINQTFLLRRLTQNISRLKFIISFLHRDKPTNINSIIYFIKDAIQFIKTKNNFRSFASKNLNLLAFRIVDHTKDTGEKYISNTRTEYWKMFAAACGGGFIVSILVMIKFKIGTLHLPLFWEGFLYSINYAIGFIAIQLSGFTLATKQPAMTASTLANALKGKSKKDFVQMAIIISKVCRTQFVSILGNVLMVIPFTLIWLFLYQQITETSFLSIAAAENQLKTNHPLLSFSVLYAAIAGFFLFLSGLASGYVENRMVYAKIPERLPNQPILKALLPNNWLKKFIKLLETRSGAIIGNLTLGILLGMSSFFGKIFGLPIDIRHITFAAGNVAMGIFGGGTDNIQFLLACVLGIFLIGVFNLLVSFSLAFYLALKARNLHISDYPQLSKMLLLHFLKTPREFFLPPKRGQSAFPGKMDSNIYSKETDIS